MSIKHVEVLRRARKLIEIVQEKYICFAINEEKIYRYEARQIKQQITRDLGGRATLNCWIFSETGKYPCNSQLTNTRLAWIDALIKYWKDKP